MSENSSYPMKIMCHPSPQTSQLRLFSVPEVVRSQKSRELWNAISTKIRCSVDGIPSHGRLHKKPNFVDFKIIFFAVVAPPSSAPRSRQLYIPDKFQFQMSIQFGIGRQTSRNRLEDLLLKMTPQSSESPTARPNVKATEERDDFPGPMIILGRWQQNAELCFPRYCIIKFGILKSNLFFFVQG
ncbi:unnamed protein product [Nesidiocoris tenuis]|uniref:Uncharacterized protein n=1 Tax=Nesidiocoris tenuis TaxID=355587 RepID=A0A6H5GA12_9HEMI|nr:unnamed protein product [Nesidiocoris tenuis]